MIKHFWTQHCWQEYSNFFCNLWQSWVFCNVNILPFQNVEVYINIYMTKWISIDFIGNAFFYNKTCVVYDIRKKNSKPFYAGLSEIWFCIVLVEEGKLPGLFKICETQKFLLCLVPLIVRNPFSINSRRIKAYSCTYIF